MKRQKVVRLVTTWRIQPVSPRPGSVVVLSAGLRFRLRNQNFSTVSSVYIDVPSSGASRSLTPDQCRMNRTVLLHVVSVRVNICNDEMNECIHQVQLQSAGSAEASHECVFMFGSTEAVLITCVLIPTPSTETDISTTRITLRLQML